MRGVAFMYRGGGNFWWASLEMIHCKRWFLFQLDCKYYNLLQDTQSRIRCLVLTPRWTVRVTDGIVAPITFNIFCWTSLLKRKFINTFRAFSKQIFATSCYLNVSLLFLPLNVCQLSFRSHLSLLIKLRNSYTVKFYENIFSRYMPGVLWGELGVEEKESVESHFKGNRPK